MLKLVRTAMTFSMRLGIYDCCLNAVIHGWTDMHSSHTAEQTCTAVIRLSRHAQQSYGWTDKHSSHTAKQTCTAVIQLSRHAQQSYLGRYIQPAYLWTDMQCAVTISNIIIVAKNKQIVNVFRQLQSFIMTRKAD